MEIRSKAMANECKNSPLLYLDEYVVSTLGALIKSMEGEDALMLLLDFCLEKSDEYVAFLPRGS